MSTTSLRDCPQDTPNPHFRAPQHSLSSTGTVPKAAVDLGAFHASVMSSTTSISAAQVVLVVLIWAVIAVVNIAYARRRPGRP
jgi:hypothetical protein